MPKYYQGRYQIKNPQKYQGDMLNCFYRSSWELRLMGFFDRHESIISWASESNIIPYYNPLDKKNHRYFVDFYIKTKDGQQFLIEVKPKKQTKPPKQPKRQTRKFLRESTTFITNTQKWQAAEKHCIENGYKFVILTEEHIGPYASDRKIEQNLQMIFGL